MNLRDWLKGRLKIRPEQLKDAHGIHDIHGASSAANNLIDKLIDTHVPGVEVSSVIFPKEEKTDGGS